MNKARRRSLRAEAMMSDLFSSSVGLELLDYIDALEDKLHIATNALADITLEPWAFDPTIKSSNIAIEALRKLK